MSTQDLNRKEYFAGSVLCVVVAALMVGVALKTPPAPIRYLFLATPYVLLWSIWWSFRSVYKKTALPRNGADDERQAMFQHLRSAIQRQTVFGCIGIAVALAMGFLLGRLGSH